MNFHVKHTKYEKDQHDFGGKAVDSVWEMVKTLMNLRKGFIFYDEISSDTFGHCISKDFNVDLLLPFIVLHSPCHAKSCNQKAIVPSHSFIDLSTTPMRETMPIMGWHK